MLSDSTLVTTNCVGTELGVWSYEDVMPFRDDGRPTTFEVSFSRNFL